MIDFSSNVYHSENLTALSEHLSTKLELLGSSDSAPVDRLEALIADRLGISSEGVLLTAGVTSAIHLLAAYFHGFASVIPQPTSGEYAAACRINNHIISYENAEPLSSLPNDRVYWICNPNNPSGNVLMKGFMDYVAKRSPQYRFVVDQSFESYTDEPLQVPRELQTLPNLLLLHSISKTYGVPGLRLGYITSAPSTISALRARRVPRSISPLAAEAGSFLLSECLPAVTDIKAYLKEAARLRKALRETGKIRVYEGKTGFMLCETTSGTSSALCNWLAAERDILVRDCSEYYGLSEDFFRVTTQNPEENDFLVSAINDYYALEEEVRKAGENQKNTF